MLKRFLFPTNPNGVFISVILLVVRIVFGILMMNHGIDKWANYQELSTVFPILSASAVPFSGIGHLWRTGMLNGIHHRLLIQIGNDSYDIYDVCGILHCSWQWSVCGKRTCICLFGGICIDVYYRTGKICRRPLDFPISFSQIEINKALLFYRILFLQLF